MLSYDMISVIVNELICSFYDYLYGYDSNSKENTKMAAI